MIMNRKALLGLIALLASAYLFAETNSEGSKVNVVISGHGVTKTLLVAANAETIKIGTGEGGVPRIEKITGLEKLANLKSFQLGFTTIDGETDTSFFRDLPKVEGLRLGFITLKNFDFLKYLPALRQVVAFDFVEFSDSNLTIDLSMNQNLERLDLGTGKLSRVPQFKGIHKSLKWLVVVGVQFERLDGIEQFQGKNLKVVVSDSDFKKLASRNLKYLVTWKESGLKAVE